MSKRLSLGKGLNSLLPADEVEAGKGPYFYCPVDAIRPNPYQPRKDIAESHLSELASSISEKGVLQPLVVRIDGDGEGYELIAGERRLRAAKMAGLNEVPVILKEVTDSDRLELALIENIQRQNLNALEEALAYEQLIDLFGLSQDEVAKQVGKDRTTVTNTLRLLNLPDYAREDLASGRISAGHARVLLSIEDDDLTRQLRDKTIREGLSVRQLEKLAKEIKKKKQAAPRKRKVPDGLPESYCRALTNDLVRYLGTKAQIVQNGTRGKLEIEYYSHDDLERVLGLIVRE